MADMETRLAHGFCLLKTQNTSVCFNNLFKLTNDVILVRKQQYIMKWRYGNKTNVNISNRYYGNINIKNKSVQMVNYC